MKHRLAELLRDLVPTVRSTIVGVLAVCLAVGAWLSVNQTTTSIERELRDERARLAASVATAMDRVTDAIVASVEAGFRTLEPWNPEALPPSERLAPLTDTWPGLTAAYVVGPTRTVAMSSEPNAQGFGRSGDHIDRAFAGEVVLTGVERPSGSNLDVLRIAVPIHLRDGSVGAVGVGELPAATGPIPEALTSFQGDAGELVQIGVATGDGNVLTANGIARADAGQSVWQPVLAPRTETGPVFVVHGPPTDMFNLTVVTEMERGWSLAITQPRVSFHPRSLRREPGSVAIPWLVGLLALLAALSVTHRRRSRVLAQDAEDTKRSFLAVTGHELRTPLTVMGGMLKTMTGALARDTVKPEMLISMVDASRRNAQLLELRIERILLVAAIEAGAGASVQPREIQLDRTVADLVETVAQTAPGHSFDVDIAEGMTVYADPKALGQIVLELLNNAVRYTPGGGRIAVAATRHGRRTSITVDDDGVGLPSDTSRLFEKFRQGEEVDKRVHDEGGVGLGLFIVRTLVEAQGGSVRAVRLDQGARFVVDLPTTA